MEICSEFNAHIAILPKFYIVGTHNLYRLQFLFTIACVSFDPLVLIIETKMRWIPSSRFAFDGEGTCMCVGRDRGRKGGRFETCQSVPVIFHILFVEFISVSEFQQKKKHIRKTRSFYPRNFYSLRSSYIYLFSI